MRMLQLSEGACLFQEFFLFCRRDFRMKDFNGRLVAQTTMFSQIDLTQTPVGEGSVRIAALPRPVVLGDAPEFGRYADRIYGQFQRMGVIHGIEMPKAAHA